jgi:hypothetical protein
VALSDHAFYLMPQEAESSGTTTSNTTSTATANKKRRFPAPLPPRAVFQDGHLPHACARHSWIHLHKLTIGFQFQRLTLTFRVPYSDVVPPEPEKTTKDQDDTTISSSLVDEAEAGNCNEFAYVVFCGNKKRCVSMVQTIQALAKTAKTWFASDMLLPSNNLMGGVFIDNDDKRLLDSLTAAVMMAKNKNKSSSTSSRSSSSSNNMILQVGMVLHYQVLKQCWKHASDTRPDVRRACVVTDTRIFLLDEAYVGDGSIQKSKVTVVATNANAKKDSTNTSSSSLMMMASGAATLIGLVDHALLDQIVEIRPAAEDPCSITLVTKPSRVKPLHKWRLVCRDGSAAQALVDAVRKAKR